KPQMLASVQVAEFFDSGLWKDMKKDIPNADKIDSEMKEKTGFTTKDFEKVVIGGTEEEMVIIVKMKKSVKVDEIKKAIKDSPMGGAEFKDSSVGKYKMYKMEEGGDEAPAFCLVNDKMIVGCNKAKVLESILKRDKKAEFTSTFQKVYDKAD